MAEAWKPTNRNATISQIQFFAPLFGLWQHISVRQNGEGGQNGEGVATSVFSISPYQVSRTLFANTSPLQSFAKHLLTLLYEARLQHVSAVRILNIFLGGISRTRLFSNTSPHHSRQLLTVTLLQGFSTALSSNMSVHHSSTKNLHTIFISNTLQRPFPLYPYNTSLQNSFWTPYSTIFRLYNASVPKRLHSTPDYYFSAGLSL